MIGTGLLFAQHPLTYINLCITYLRMKIEISSSEAARKLGDCLARIKHTGDHFVLTKNNRPIAELRQVPESRETTLGTLLAAMRSVEVDEDFAGDLEKANASDIVLENPWR